MYCFQEFWDYLFATSVPWGMLVYEQVSINYINFVAHVLCSYTNQNFTCSKLFHIIILLLNIHVSDVVLDDLKSILCKITICKLCVP